MKKYDYLQAVTEIEEQLNDDLFCCDSVTGNASGSYMKNCDLIQFTTATDAARYIVEHQNTGDERTINGCICFGMGIYAYRKEAAAAGLCTAAGPAFYHIKSIREICILLRWLTLNDGYLYAA